MGGSDCKNLLGWENQMARTDCVGESDGKNWLWWFNQMARSDCGSLIRWIAKIGWAICSHVLRLRNEVTTGNALYIYVIYTVPLQGNISWFVKVGSSRVGNKLVFHLSTIHLSKVVSDMCMICKMLLSKMKFDWLKRGTYSLQSRCSNLRTSGLKQHLLSML